MTTKRHTRKFVLVPSDVAQRLVSQYQKLQEEDERARLRALQGDTGALLDRTNIPDDQKLYEYMQRHQGHLAAIRAAERPTQLDLHTALDDPGLDVVDDSVNRPVTTLLRAVEGVN